MDFLKFCIYLILLLLYLFCPSPWGSIEFKRKIEISSHDKERRDWNLHLKHENHVKMEKDFFILSTLLSASTPQLFLDQLPHTQYYFFHMAQWVAPEHLKCTLRHKLQPDYPPFMMILTLLAFLLWFQTNQAMHHNKNLISIKYFQIDFHTFVMIIAIALMFFFDC